MVRDTDHESAPEPPVPLDEGAPLTRAERTLAALRSALAQSPKNGSLWLEVGEILCELGRQHEAAEACDEAVRHLVDGPELGRAEELLRELRPAPAPAPSNVFTLVKGGAPPGAAPRPGASPAEERVTFGDVGGLDAVKEAIRMRIVLPFQHPEIFAAYRKKPGGGILMYGPPGCGKTLLARATAGECGARFINVAIDDVLDMWFGESERKLAALFEEARSHAPAVLFFDEIEAIGGSRQQLRGSPGRVLVNQLLSEMDGMAGRNERVLVMGATNAPWHVDPALRRPGRFDRVLFVPPPDRAARLEILRLALRSRPIADSVDLAGLAAKAEGYSGADLSDLVEQAAEGPIRQALTDGTIRPIGEKDLLGTLAAARPSTKEWFSTAKNYATFSNVGGLYDDLVAYLAERR
ncbi:MAG TPA: ATP-binding protein [Thermoanaerobaculia bacterium]|nr:ATP-binding protein [Thermoanaerobaculia bacterium]